ncbi:Uncharacterised protein [Mycobacteroides abscessus subsp. massiliense]|nr:Uncharacterised protein [Mycobacteroides abscessus subsp. massiliense]
MTRTDPQCSTFIHPSGPVPLRHWRPVSPDQIQAVGGVIVAVLGAWQARTSRKVRDLEARLVSRNTT